MGAAGTREATVVAAIAGREVSEELKEDLLGSDFDIWRPCAGARRAAHPDRALSTVMLSLEAMTARLDKLAERA